MLPSDDSRQPLTRESELAAVLTEVIDRQRSGDRPTLAEYLARYPHLEDDLRGHFEMIELLEGESWMATPPNALGDAISSLPEAVQELIFLRNFQRLSWAEIASRRREPEESLRRTYACALKVLLERCSGPLGAGRPAE